MSPLDERLLAEAREAQAAQVHAHAQAELARVRFADAVRRLHAGGASMREIARAFGLSHQRVHQIATGKGGPEPRCSFCGAAAPAARLIAGPGVFVCDRCVPLADRAMGGDPAAEQAWAAQRSAAATGGRSGPDDDRCSFCGKGPEQVDAIAGGDGFRICRECLDLCAEIIEEERGGG